MSERLDEAFRAHLNAMLTEALGREPRWRYFARGNGPMFYWTTERDGTGKYQSGVYRPYGPGSRSDKANRWQIADDEISRHALRKDAKARALRLFREWKAAHDG